MDFKYSNDGFLPYESFEYIYSDREMPEFGAVASPFIQGLDTWRFFLARNEGEIPFGFESINFDDSEWNLINVPSTWQTEGYGLPNNLLYNYPETLQNLSKREESISDKYILRSNSTEDDEFGIYRARVVFDEKDINRALYIETSGICGSFDVYINGNKVCSSHAVLTKKKLLISEYVNSGINQIVIIVNRYDRDNRGYIINDYMNHGFSGIFRPIYIVKESLMEISNLHITMENVPEAYLTEIANVNLPTTKTGAIAKVPHGDFLLKADFEIFNHTDYFMPYQVRVSLLEARAEYDPYNLPFVKIKDQGGAVRGNIDAHKSVRESTMMVALDIAMWSDATPVQYDLAIELLDAQGNVIVAKKKRFGFRTSAIVQNKLNINDRRINISAVKYYEFDTKGGITAPLDVMRQDIILMKRAGINTVICNGTPLSDDFLNLCDQYGMYVIAQSADIVMRDYVESAMIHPSIVMWGIQNYRFDAVKATGAKSVVNQIDGTRPFYSEGDYECHVSDMIPMPSDAGAVFGPWQDLCLDRKSVFDKNKTGKNLFATIPGRIKFTDDDADYKWIHHADLVGGKNKEDSCIGQGIVDAERNPHPIYMDIKKQCQSLNIFASADDPTSLTLRNTHPFAYTHELELEWKILLGGQKLMSGSGDISEIEPYGTRTLRFPINVSKFLTPGWAGGKAEYVELYMKSLSHELVFDISLKLSKNTYYAGKGYEVAFYQDVLAKEIASPAADDEGTRLTGLNAYSIGGLIEKQEEEPKQMALEANSSEPSDDSEDTLTRIEDDETNVERMEETSEEMVLEDAISLPDDGPVEESFSEISNETTCLVSPKGINLGNGQYSFTFDRNNGGVKSIEINGFNFLMGSFKPSFYRCPSNIDRTDKSFVLAKTIFSKESDYEEIQESLEFKDLNYGVNNGVFNMITRYKSFAMKGDVIMYYEIPSADKLKVTLTFTPKYDMIRYGIRVPIVKNDILCTWYGRGPGESYHDRKNATKLGLFAAGADKIYHPYARPAENSSHCDTEVVKISNKSGDSFSIRREGNEKFEFTVLPYTPEQMNEYLHEEQLLVNDFCELFADFCSKEIERTVDNISTRPLKKNVTYKETFEITLEKAE